MGQSRLRRHPLAAALFATLAIPALASAQQTQTTDTTTPAQDQKTSDSKKANELDKVVVTGSLIPQTQKETSAPLTTITAQAIQQRGFDGVAAALKDGAQSTGGVQGEGTSGGFTQGASTMSLFGLNPGYTKYLIDGRPMANYPALYNGSDVFNNIDGIPTDLVDRIEILPGGQSSLYGSDAIAGVVNFKLKKRVNGPSFSLRYGDYQHGGGDGYRASFSDGFSAVNGRWNTLIGIQLEKKNPIWASQRALTKTYRGTGYNGSVGYGSLDWLVYGYTDIANQGLDNYGGVFMDPNNCANVTSAFGGSEAMRPSPSWGPHCGSFMTPGYATLANGKREASFYTHSTFDLSQNAQLYFDFMYDRNTVRYHSGSNYLWWGTGLDYGYYYDPNLDGLVNLQRSFAPEDVGNWADTGSKNTSRAWTGTIGVNGTFGQSTWDYDVGFTHNEYKLSEQDLVRLAGPIDAWFEKNVLGPQQGWDPYYGAYPVFTPDYAKFYSLMTPADFASFTSRSNSQSKTYDNMLRAQVTNSSLFKLPGGDAGLAVAAEYGKQGWRYDPDPRILDGSIWGLTGVSGDGSRTRYALTGEIRMPFTKMLTVSASGRYDSFRVANNNVSKATYNLGLEFRPVESLLFRGQYGTAFKIPTLAEQFQGTSGFYSSAVDYYNCARLGYDPGNISKCPARYTNVQFKGYQHGNPDLQPINAKVWKLGMVWAPTTRFSLSADYLSWNIKNEVALQSVDQLLRDEMACRLGQLDASSGTCQAALGQVHRGSSGTIQTIDLGKINIAEEKLRAVIMEGHYVQPIGAFGRLTFSAAYNKNLSHRFRQYPNDPEVDLLNDPWWSTDPIYKANGSVTWDFKRFSSTLYASYIGPTPNYRASNISAAGYAVVGAGKLPSSTTFNASVTYKFSDDLDLSLMVNNLTDKDPPYDGSYPGSSSRPFNNYNYSVLGRAYYLQAHWSFGGSKK